MVTTLAGIGNEQIRFNGGTMNFRITVQVKNFDVNPTI